MVDLPEHCAPCRTGDRALSADEARALAEGVPAWTLEASRLEREFLFPDFRAALAWVNRVGTLAEEEQHHPDLHLTDWRRVRLVLWTHAVGGLHVNDFVLARRIDELWERDDAGSAR